MSKRNSIFLVGPMGAGKTTIGKLLAKSLHKRFLDSDHVIEQRTGAHIPLIFELEGEQGFRKREKVVLNELSRQDDVVIATGGGIVLDPENRKALSNNGLVIYLHAPLEHLYQRTIKDKNRPLLQTENPRAALEQLILQRESLYKGIARLSVDTSQFTVRNLLIYLIEQINDIWEN